MALMAPPIMAVAEAYGFQTAKAAAPALRSRGIYRRMPYFGGNMKEPVIQYYAAPDAGAESQHDETAEIPAGARDFFPEGCRICIVFDQSPCPVSLGDFILEGPRPTKPVYWATSGRLPQLRRRSRRRQDRSRRPACLRARSG